MRRSWKKLGVIFVIIMAVAACQQLPPIYNVEDNAVPLVAQQKLSSEQIGKIIAEAVINKGYSIDAVKPGVLRCTLNWWNQHSAIIDITYSKENYSINLVSSENLKEADGKIHGNYNERIQKLQSEINTRLSMVAFN